jgi:protein-S-isoprenylcysteine O-methyltransferase Ste14
LRSPVSIPVFAASVAFVLHRIGREERLLTEEFPESYREYQKHSWRLLPRVY